MEIAFATLSDQELVSLTLQNERRAYDALVNRYEKTLWAMLQNRGVNEPQDIVQESFIKAYLNLGQYDPRYTFGQWITTIARNLHIDHTRRHKSSETTLSLETVNTPCAAPNPEQSIITSQNEALIQNHLNSLPQNYRVILTMRFWDEMSYEEIAAKLQIPIGTVKTQIHRARTQLIQFLTNA